MDQLGNRDRDEASRSSTNLSTRSPASQSFVAPDFWQTLVEAVEDVRQVIDSEDESEGSGEAQTSPEDQAATLPVGSEALLFGYTLAMSTPSHDAHWSHEQLTSIYHDRFDALFKVLHWPTAIAQMTQADPKPWSCSFVEQQALRSAVHFGAVCTLQAHEVSEKSAITEQYRSVAETSLISAGLLTTRSLVVLQAFVIYLSAIDRGFKPLLRSKDFQVLPLNVNDADIPCEDDPGSSIASSSDRDDFTEMTFPQVSCRAGLSLRRVAEHQFAESAAGCSPNAWWERQVAIVNEHEAYVMTLSHRFDALNQPTPLQAFTIAVARESLLAMRLQLHRPLYRHPHDLRPPSGGFDVLQAAVEVLESAAFKVRPEFAKWSWFAWVKWYALAIVLAELCTRTWDERSAQAWIIAQTSYDAYAQVVADAESGHLWKPIARLMRKATEIARSQNLPMPLAGQNEVQHTDHDPNLMTQMPPLSSSMENDGGKPFQALDFDFGMAGGDEYDPLAWMHWDMFVDDMQQNNVQGLGLP
ncbi:uncharacterized protein LTR77_006869 [Saxophila tyrrhenica]|uniref:Transcription factor domain-containing protein n=1 Tax=Saxophila tyrrhenica TaxID=1690608 RepID=A0AAV9P9F5_9PEZI|nr:hypothetical protein LTR77_006869 [Saxophila tyrrhenica]